MLAKGQIVAGYRIDGVVGRGGSGVVYEATQLAVGRKVALKVLDPGITSLFADGTTSFRGRFRRQAAIDHPHLLTAFDMGTVRELDSTEDQLYLAMPIVDGSNLKDLIVTGSLDADRTLRLLSQVADALDTVHAAGLEHGDVKPQNILVAPGDHAYLTDLAMPTMRSGRTGYRTATGMFVGTVDYASPEAVEGLSRGPASDVYALAAVLYECLTGAPPYPRERDVDVLLAHLYDVPPSVTEQRPDLPFALDSVIWRGMAKDPYSRLQRAGDLVGRADRAFRYPDEVTGSIEGDAPDETRLRRNLREAALAGVVPEAGAIGTLTPRVAPDPREIPPRPSPARAPVGRRPWKRRTLGTPSVHLLRIAVSSLLVLGTAVAAARWLLGLFVDPVESAEAAADTVECTVFSPLSAAPGNSILVQVFVHLPEEAEDARAIAMELDTDARRRTFRSLESPVPLGSRLHFELRMPGLEIDDPVASLVWRRRTEAVQFGVRIPSAAPAGTVVGTLAVSLDSAPIGHVKFKLAIEVDAPTAPSEPQGEDARRYTLAFISYSSKDRDEVLRRVQLLAIVGIEYFQDVLSLEPGDRFSRRVELGIDECDLFLLFWSSDAKKSDWVRREVRHALSRKGGDDLSSPEIRPVILEGPPIVEPWEELAHLHFNDRLLYFMTPRGK